MKLSPRAASPRSGLLPAVAAAVALIGAAFSPPAPPPLTTVVPRPYRVKAKADLDTNSFSKITSAVLLTDALQFTNVDTITVGGAVYIRFNDADWAMMVSKFTNVVTRNIAVKFK